LNDGPRAYQARSAAVDLGASSGRVMLGTLDAGSIALQEIRRFRTPSFHEPATGYQCWDIDHILGEAIAGLDQCASTGAIHSIGVDSWAVDFVLLDERMQRIAPPVCYREKHTAGMMDAVCSRIPAPEIYSRTGIQFQPFNTLYQLAGLAVRHPQRLAVARRLLMIPDYLHFRLCGVAANEYTNATTTQMLALDGSWDPDLLAASGLPAGALTSPVAAGTILGPAKLNSCPAHIVATATHDTASAVAGTPLDGPDEAYISSGTWSLMGIESPEPIATAEAMRMNFTNEGGYQRRFRVLKNIMGMWPLQRMCDERCVSSIDSLIAEAAAVPAWRSIVNLDDAAFLNPADMTATIAQFCRHTGQPVPSTSAELARCILDSLALTYGRVKRQLEQLHGRPLSRIRIVGGGSRNRLLNQLCADTCELPVSAGPVEASTLGNLAVQWIALGILHNLENARALIRASFPCEEFVPQNTVAAGVWNQFEQLTNTRFAEEVECS
jgi:rhamnulokinase